MVDNLLLDDGRVECINITSLLVCSCEDLELNQGSCSERIQ